MNDSTGGSDTREARTLDAPVLAFDLPHELARLRSEPGFAQFGRSSKTLAKSSTLRLVLTATRAGARVGEDDAEATVAVQVIDGRVSIDRDGRALELGTGSLAWLGGAQGWAVRSEEDSAVLLTISWPGTGDAGR